MKSTYLSLLFLSQTIALSNAFSMWNLIPEFVEDLLRPAFPITVGAEFSNEEVMTAYDANTLLVEHGMVS